MFRRRQGKLGYLLGSLLVLVASLHPTTAYSAPGDPPAGSPAGAVYQLPLEQGRSDAAPKSGGGTEAATGGDSGSGSGGSVPSANAGGESSPSLYRSENDFGSSSRVPGAVSAAGVGAPAAGSSDGAAERGRRGGAATITAETADTGNASVAAAAVLLGAIALVAMGVGILSRRHSRV